MLGRRDLSFGQIDELATRPLPLALPEGVPLDNVGTQRPAPLGGDGPNIVKDGTPHGALSSVGSSQRATDTRGSVLPTVGGLEVARAPSRGPRCERPSAAATHRHQRVAVSQPAPSPACLEPGLRSPWQRPLSLLTVCCAGVPLPTILRLVRHILAARWAANIVGGGNHGERDGRRPRRLHRAVPTSNHRLSGATPAPSPCGDALSSGDSSPRHSPDDSLLLRMTDA